MGIDLRTSRMKDMTTIRDKVGGDDPFMEGHQIKKVRRITKDIPTWALNDTAVRKLVLRSFPTLLTNQAVAQRAGRWVRIITLYYRMQMPSNHVAKEMDMSLNALKMALKHIRRAARGWRADNTGPMKGIK